VGTPARYKYICNLKAVSDITTDVTQILDLSNKIISPLTNKLKNDLDIKKKMDSISTLKNSLLVLMIIYFYH
jgi:hypothetical protein